jgi:hypothetical protein
MSVVCTTCRAALRGKPPKAKADTNTPVSTTTLSRLLLVGVEPPAYFSHCTLYV